MSEGTSVVKIPAQGKELMQVLDIKLSDPSEAASRIALRLAFADNVEDLLSEDGAAGWEQHLDVPVLVTSVSWLPSTFNEGVGFYAVVEATRVDNNAPLVLTTGSTGVMIQLAKMQQMGWLATPVKLKLNDNPTSNGFRPHRLVKA